jgi:hypothetical protein
MRAVTGSIRLRERMVRVGTFSFSGATAEVCRETRFEGPASDMQPANAISKR